MNSLPTRRADVVEPGDALEPHRSLKLRYKLGLLLSALIAAVLAFELLLRLAAPQHPSWLAIYRNHPAIDTYTLQANVNTVVDTGEGRYSVRTDENGRRVGSNGPSATDRRPVMFVLGDSYTFGQGVSYEESTAGYLDASPQVTLRPINAAVGGYGPTQYLMVLEYLLNQSLDPKFVLLVIYTGNDFHDCLWNKQSRVADGIINNPRTVRAWVKRSSHLYRLLAKSYHLYGDAGEDEFTQLVRELADGENWETGRLSEARQLFAASLAAIRSLCAERSLPLGVVLIPTKQAIASQRGEPTQEYGNGKALDHILPVRNAVSICNELGLEFLDLTETLAAYPTDDTYFPFDGHFTPLAHRIAASAIINSFRELRAEVKADSR